LPPSDKVKTECSFTTPPHILAQRVLGQLTLTLPRLIPI